MAQPCHEWTDPSFCWFALRTRYRHEHLVRDQLLAKGIEPFLPTVARWSRWRDRKKRIQWPLFEGYCFARFGSALRVSVLSCAGVIEIVSSEKRPAAIPDHEIEGIRRLVTSGLEYDPHPFLRDKVKDGKLGMKSGEGFRRWTPEQADAVRERLRRFLAEQARAAKNKAR